MIEISVVIPNWNGRKLLEKCLPSVFNQSFNDFEVILVDNGSTDDSCEFVRKNFPQVKIIQLPRNFGFAKAVNRGIDKSRAPFVALLNNDTKVDPNWLGNLYKAMLEHSEVFAVAPKVLVKQNPNLIENAGDKINIIGQAFPIGRGEPAEKFSKPGYVFGASGAASLFRMEVLKRLEGFDEDFFFYFEDVDFALRAQLTGYKCWYTPAAVVFHQTETTAAKLGKFLEYQRFRNTIFLVVKNFPLGLIIKRGRWWKIPLVWAHTFYFFGKKGLVVQALQALIDVVIHLPRLIQKRMEIMKIRKVDINYLDSLMENKKLKIFGWRV